MFHVEHFRKQQWSGRGSCGYLDEKVVVLDHLGRFAGRFFDATSICRTEIDVCGPQFTKLSREEEERQARRGFGRLPGQGSSGSSTSVPHVRRFAGRPLRLYAKCAVVDHLLLVWFVMGVVLQLSR